MSIHWSEANERGDLEVGLVTEYLVRHRLFDIRPSFSPDPVRRLFHIIVNADGQLHEIPSSDPAELLGQAETP